MPAVHSQSITGAALKARSQVIQSFRVAARPGLAAVAAAAAKEIKLFLNATIHAAKLAWSVMTCPTTDLSISTKDQSAKL